MRQWVRKRRCVRVTRHMLAEKEREPREREREREERCGCCYYYLFVLEPKARKLYFLLATIHCRSILATYSIVDPNLFSDCRVSLR